MICCHCVVHVKCVWGDVASGYWCAMTAQSRQSFTPNRQSFETLKKVALVLLFYSIWPFLYFKWHWCMCSEHEVELEKENVDYSGRERRGNVCAVPKKSFSNVSSWNRTVLLCLAVCPHPSVCLGKKYSYSRQSLTFVPTNFSVWQTARHLLNISNCLIRAKDAC